MAFGAQCRSAIASASYQRAPRGRAQMRRVESAENAVPVGIVALAPQQQGRSFSRVPSKSDSRCRFSSQALRTFSETCSIFLCSRFDSEYLVKNPRHCRRAKTAARPGAGEILSRDRGNGFAPTVGSDHSIISVYEAVGRSARPSGACEATASPGRAGFQPFGVLRSSAVKRFSSQPSS